MARRKPQQGRLQFVAAVLLLCGSLMAHCGEPGDLILHLKNGDRLTGKLVSEDGDRVVLTTKWNTAIHVPKAEIERRELVASEAAPVSAGATAPSDNHATVQPQKSVAAKTVAVKKPKPPATKAPEKKKLDHWKWNLKLGTDVIVGANNRENYYGQTTVTYTRNYKRNPKQFVRNTLDYRVDYGETDSRTTADRMFGSDKLDLDVGSQFYGYNSARAGYDRPRRIAFEYEFGPGFGYHAFASKALALDTEVGLNYQSREGLDAPDRHVFRGRVGQELTWQIIPKLTFSQKFELLPFINDEGNYQIRVEGNLGVGLVNHMSLHLTVLNSYDSLPGPNVPRNEFQFRSALGVNF